MPKIYCYKLFKYSIYKIQSYSRVGPSAEIGILLLRSLAISYILYQNYLDC